MTADTTDLRGVQASVDAWIALSVTVVAAKASEAVLGERMRNIDRTGAGRELANSEGVEGGNVVCCGPRTPRLN